MPRQMTTHRISHGYDGTLVCYMRDEQGPVDLSSASLTLSLRAYGQTPVLATVDASQESVGKVVGTIPAVVTLCQLPGTLYRFDIEADGMTVYQALLEVM